MAALKHNGHEIARITVEVAAYDDEPDTWYRIHSVRSNGWILRKTVRVDRLGRRHHLGWKRWKRSLASDLHEAAKALFRLLERKVGVQYDSVTLDHTERTS